jgi:hypothetical protein
VEREVESMLHESHVEQLNTIAKRFNASAVAELEEKEDLIEVTERRNLYAHQGGRITAYYLAKAKKAPGDHNPGQSLITEPAYFDEACNVIILAAIKMTQMVWRAVGGPAKLGAADRDLSQIAYEYLLYQQWELAGRILRFAGTVEHSTEQHMLVFAINHAQAFKWQGNTKACESVLSKIDWNAKDQALQLSRAVLLEDYEEAARLMYDVGSTRQVQKSAFDYWPIYRDFRKSDIYRHVYMELYKQPPPEVDDDETLDL